MMSGMSPHKADRESRNQPIIGKREILGDVITACLRIRGMKELRRSEKRKSAASGGRGLLPDAAEDA